MRLTQGTFSFLPDLTDEQISAQIEYCLQQRLGRVGRVHRRPASAQHLLGDVRACRCSTCRDAAGVMLEIDSVPQDHSRITTSR